jgi:alpha-glucosidase
MQNGSLGRLIDVEARAYNDGVAFRYVIPPSTPLMEMIIVEEATEFRFAEIIPRPTGYAVAVTASDDSVPYALIPLSKAWVAITESKPGSYPPMHFVSLDRTTELTRLDRPFQAPAPLNCPWRIISIGQGPGQASRSGIMADLNR